MAWSTPPTWYPGLLITSAQLNILRDCLLETPAAKATTAGGYFVATGPNAIAERLAAQAIVDVSESTASTSYTSLGTDGPTLANLTTGTQAIVFTTAQMSNSTTGSTYSSFEVSGATAVAAADTRAVIYDGNGAGPNSRITTATLQVLTAGSNTFRMLYRASSGTGSFNRRRLLVMPL